MSFIKFLLLQGIMVCFMGVVLHADSVVPTKIKTLLMQVKKAPVTERRVLMNALKIELRSMHQAQKKQIMLQLRESFAQGNKHFNHAKMKAMKQHSKSMNANAKHMHENRKSHRKHGKGKH